MPQKKLLNFACAQGLPLTPEQIDKLLAYAHCVWEKKDFLNLTSVQSFQEILLRHICDGIVAAACITKLQLFNESDTVLIADAGAGCGYIGLTLAACLPQARVLLIESLQRRCKFMNWAAVQANISNVQVKNIRLGQKTSVQADILTERAMGPLSEIGPLCLEAVKPGGYFIAFQGEKASAWGDGEAYPYILPCDDKKRHLVIYKRDEK